MVIQFLCNITKWQFELFQAQATAYTSLANDLWQIDIKWREIKNLKKKCYFLIFLTIFFWEKDEFILQLRGT